MSEPCKITLGDSKTWTRSMSSYPASDGWVLTYRLVGPSTLTVVADADGDGFSATISAAASAALTAGRYRLHGRVVLGAITQTIYDGPLQAAVDPANPPAGYDPRTWAEITLEAIEAAITGTASTTQLSRSVTVGSVTRTISEASHADLLMFRNFLKAEIHAQKYGAGFTTRKVRFTKG